MKISKLTPDMYGKASALLRQAFPKSNYEVQLVENFHKNGTAVHEWVCVHTNKVVAYIAFSNAYEGSGVRSPSGTPGCEAGVSTAGNRVRVVAFCLEAGGD